MNWNVKKFEEKNTPKFLSFEVIKRVIDNKEDKETKKENEFSYQARMFIKDFEGFSKTKDKPKNHQEEPQEKQKRENTAYAYYDSEGIPTIGYGFNLRNKDGFNAVFNMVFANLLESDCNSHALEICNVIKAKNTNLGDLDSYSYKQCKNLASNFKQAFWAGKWKNKKEKGESDQELQGKIQDFIRNHLNIEKEFSLTKEQAKNILASLIYKKIRTITNSMRIGSKTTREDIVKTFLGSSEGVALLSLYYNNPSLIGGGLIGAYEKKNRFKMWFEIRYNSNGGNNIGIAKRRFAESNVFGLFENTKRGEYSNTANWGFVNNENTNKAELRETIQFFISLHSKFEKEECNTYFEYVEYYESEKSFGGTTILDKIGAEKKDDKPDLQHHFRPYTEVFSPFVKKFNEAMKNAGCQCDFTLEEILVVNKDNRTSIIKTINEESKDKELAIILEKGHDLGFLKYQNKNIENSKTLHIILAYDNHIDCLGFESASNIVFYVLKDNKIIKLCGCKEALEPKEISFQDTTLKGLMQINQDEGIIYCFKEQANKKFSPNLSIYCKDTFELLATIYNLRSEGDNNA